MHEPGKPDFDELLCHARAGDSEVRQVLLADALARLPEHYRDVVVLHHLEGRSMREVARALDRSTDSVKKLWARAMVQLRKLMQDDN